MLVFRNRPAWQAALASVLLTPLALSPAAAQIGPPVPLAPPVGQPSAPPGVPAPYPPPPGYAPPPAANPQPGYTPPAPPPSGITVDQLAAPSPEATGVLGPSNHGFPDTMWQGTARATVLALLPKISSTTSPALQDLAYRLLA